MTATSSGHPFLPRIIGVILLLSGLALVFGGIKLLMLGGSWYYLPAGLAVAIAGLLLLWRNASALSLYGLFLIISTIWAWSEIGLDWWQLVPRLALWFGLGLLLILPWFRKPLLTPNTSPVHTVMLSIGLLMAGGSALISQFVDQDKYSLKGTLDRTSTEMTSTAPAQPAGDWQSYGRTAFGDRYSPLAQITPDNVQKLEVAWKYRTGDVPGENDPHETTAENTPLKVNGKLYVCTPHSKVIALDPDTGKEIWRFDPQLSTQRAGTFKNWAHMTCRGVAYHDDAEYAQQTSGTNIPADATSVASNTTASTTANAGNSLPVATTTDPLVTTVAPAPASATNTAKTTCSKRIFVPTADTRLIAINADTGQMCREFGKDGSVDLTANMGSFTAGGYYSTSPPAVTRNLVIIGGHVTDNLSTDEPSGVIRAYDVHDGHLVWNWDSGNPTQTAPIAADGIYTRNSPNMWSVTAVDEKNGLLYLPMGNQMPDQWGGNRTKASETYSAGVTALDIATGQVHWTFQMTHHDLWDMDVGGQPTLIDIKTAQGVQPALMASTKQGSIYVLNRLTGKPVYPVKETPVPQGHEKEVLASGEYYSPTQPISDINFVPKMSEKDMWGGTPFDQLICRIQYKSMNYQGIYTPPSLQGSLVYPGNFGVFDWGGISVDPVRQIAFVNPNFMAFKSKLVPREAVANGAARKSEVEGVQPNKGAPFGVILEPFISPTGLPCQAPAWGYIAAIDLTTGKKIWMHKNGTVRDNSPLPLFFKMGVPSLGGTITTAGGVGFLSGTLDQYLRAYDMKSGKELWRGRLPAGAQTTPMTYAGKDGQQYVLVMAGGHGSLGTRKGDYVYAYKLPKT
ncbi:glucose/quinate/shikimate family membrane-bound PQQ-dependent dehydrogenase [Alkanindiges illinoisensis]|uniref:glucose/quinate/shikimate family membrane-bound PQQ-dependent dehydrogenase n=1 Tax=Alkanindiges illinoisensis TaxID=197183 RepID=UPI00047EBCDE|nr:glucose/quinate/shikimate family membrane-bound PQQ-dependent dehydrogenase [Alkanindiges illinoisensis]